MCELVVFPIIFEVHCCFLVGWGDVKSLETHLHTPYVMYIVEQHQILCNEAYSIGGYIDASDISRLTILSCTDKFSRSMYGC